MERRWEKEGGGKREGRRGRRNHSDVGYLEFERAVVIYRSMCGEEIIMHSRVGQPLTYL